MSSLRFASVFLFGALLAVAAAAAAEDPKDDKTVAASETSRKAVETWLAAKSKDDAPPIAPKILAVDDKVGNVFPDDRFYVVRYMRYPRAVKPPDSLKLENLVRVRHDGTVEHIASLDGLKKLFARKLRAVKNETEARNVLLAFLRLAQEFYQDGAYTFSMPEDSISVVRNGDNLVASGKSLVTKGGRGEITATLSTEAPDKTEVKGKVRADVRLR